jgi:hypothetical protein
VTANLCHPAQTTRQVQAPHFCADTLSRLTGKESPHEFHHEFKHAIELEHEADGGAGRTKSKGGKTGSGLDMAKVPSFPPFANPN